MSDNFKQRDVFSKILKFLKIPEILVLHGARQVGKTTLMKMTINHLKENNINNIFYFDLEDKNFLDLCNSGLEEIIKYINARKSPEIRKGEKIYLFIDEIQYLDNPSGLLKMIYDHHKNDYKLVVSGSSSFAIKSKFKDSLVGRIIDLEIFGLNFKEFLNFKNYNYNLNEDSDLANDELKKIYREYMLYGAYPQVVLVDNLELKETYIENIIEKYIYKDIKDLANIKNIEKFNSLLKLLASQSGQLLNTSEISNTLGISRITTDEYLFILENTYIIKLIRPYYKNIRNELTKMPKIFFEDLGILNILKNKKLSDEINGSNFENSIYCYLRQKYSTKDINYWRTKSKQEIDFIVSAEDVIPLEVKLAFQDKNIKNLVYFANEYVIKNSYCVTLQKNASKYKNIKQIYPWEIEKLYI